MVVPPAPSAPTAADPSFPFVQGTPLVRVGKISAAAVDLTSITLLSYLFATRISPTRWRRRTTTTMKQASVSVSVAQWSIAAVYVSSFMFVFAASFLKLGLGLDGHPGACAAASLLCVVAYFATKMCVYLFLVERAYIVRASGKARLKDRVWLFNTFGMLVPYTAVAVVALVFRSGTVRADGKCVLVLRPVSDIAVIVLDLTVNVYLAGLFLVPLAQAFPFRRQPSRHRRRLATRTLVGCVGTLIPTVINMSTMLGLKEEYGWLCLLTCNIDIVICVLVLHWVTADSADSNVVCTFCRRHTPSPTPAAPSPSTPGGPLPHPPPPISRLHTANGKLSPYVVQTYYPGLSVDDDERGELTTVDVTTTISADPHGREEEDLTVQLRREGARADVPLGGIQVRVEQTQEFTDVRSREKVQGWDVGVVEDVREVEVVDEEHLVGGAGLPRKEGDGEEAAEGEQEGEQRKYVVGCNINMHPSSK